jgi:hypothetical protein
MALWLLGYPDAALADAKQALQEARDIGQAPTLMFALFFFDPNFLRELRDRNEGTR